MRAGRGAIAHVARELKAVDSRVVEVKQAQEGPVVLEARVAVQAKAPAGKVD